jgi:hypothetical protein
MIAQTFEDVFSPQWVETHIIDPTHNLVVLRHIIPWQSIIDQLVPSYTPNKGRMGRSLRILVGVSMAARLRQLSDRKVIKEVQENRYLQYFCNVPDQGLLTFLNPSTLCRFRQRLGQEGVGAIEKHVFQHLKRAGAIKADMMRMDSSVLESPITYPNDVRLLYKACGKLGQFAKQQRLPLWWNQNTLKSRWRAFNLSKAEERQSYLSEFHALFVSALRIGTPNPFFARSPRDLAFGASPRPPLPATALPAGPARRGRPSGAPQGKVESGTARPGQGPQAGAGSGRWGDHGGKTSGRAV